MRRRPAPRRSKADLRLKWRLRVGQRSAKDAETVVGMPRPVLIEGPISGISKNKKFGHVRTEPSSPLLQLTPPVRISILHRAEKESLRHAHAGSLDSFWIRRSRAGGCKRGWRVTSIHALRRSGCAPAFGRHTRAAIVCRLFLHPIGRDDARPGELLTFATDAPSSSACCSRTPSSSVGRCCAWCTTTRCSRHDGHAVCSARLLGKLEGVRASTNRHPLPFSHQHGDDRRLDHVRTN
jgi:hypothetical protein